MRRAALVSVLIASALVGLPKAQRLVRGVAVLRR